MSTLEQVMLFHHTFGHPIKDEPDISDPKLNELRVELLREELAELKEALDAGNMVDVLDALCDLQYVLDGAFLAFGLHHVKAHAFAEVQRSNMSKAGPDGKPIVRDDGKILKGPDYTPPNLEQFIWNR